MQFEWIRIHLILIFFLEAGNSMPDLAYTSVSEISNSKNKYQYKTESSVFKQKEK